MSFGQTVDFVVEQQNVDVDIASDGVDEVIATDGQSVSVSGDMPDRQLGIGHLDARGDGCGPTMDAMKSIGVDIIGEAGRTADPGYKSKTLVSVVEFFGHFGQGFENRIENGVVPATGTPFDLLIAAEISG